MGKKNQAKIREKSCAMNYQVSQRAPKHNTHAKFDIYSSRLGVRMNLLEQFIELGLIGKWNICRDSLPKYAFKVPDSFEC